MRKLTLAPLAVLMLGGCGIDKYTRDPTNLTVLAIFSGLCILMFLVFVGVRRPDQRLQQMEMTRQERRWFEELEELRANFVLAQQSVLDRCMALMTDKQKEDPELKRLRLKAHSAMAKVIELQGEMLRNGVSDEKVNAWEEL